MDAVFPIQLLPGLPLSALGALAPTLAAAILVYKNDRLAGVWRLLQRSFDFKRVTNKAWFLAFILVNPVIDALAYAIMRAVGEFLPYPAPLTLAIFPIFVFFFIGALGEEIGWSGFATEPLVRRWGGVTAGVLLGAIWAVWHFIPLVQAHRSVESIVWWSLGTLSLRMILVWLYTHAGKSVFAAALFHTMINVCWQLFPVNGSFYDPRVFGLITLFVAVAVIIAGRFRAKSSMPAA